MLSLRPYQTAVVDAVRERYIAGDRSTLVVLPTGTGKTVAFAECARRTVDRGGRVLVLAHRTELLEQAKAKLHAGGVEARIEQAHQHGGAADVVVASVQSLRGARLERFAPDAFALVIVDEAHHAMAAGYRAILERFASARHLGVTATPDRLDGKGLGEVFASCAYRYDLRDAIRDGWLVPIVARRIEVQGVDLTSVHTRAGDLDQRELGAVMLDETALHGVIVPLLRESSGRRTLGFAVDVAHAHALAEVANRYQPGCARALDGDMAAEDRRRLLAAFRAGEFRVLFNCGVLTEGFDDPAIACIALCRPTKSRALLTQMIGRGTRPAPESGKCDLLVLGMAPSTLGRHSLVGPADVLAGRELEDDVRAELDKLLTGGQRVLDDVLDHVEDDIARRRVEHKATATARYFATEIDPFVGEMPSETFLREDQRAMDEYRGSSHDASRGTAATPGQLAALARLGLEHPPDTLTVSEAGAWIRGLERRKELGLCSLKQSRLLSRHGYTNTAAMSFAEANRLIPRLLANFSARRSMARGDAA